MVVYGEGANPRFMFNRTVDGGQQANGGMIAIENKAFDANTGAIVLDLKKDLVRTVPGEDPTVDDFAHLVTIKLDGAVLALFLLSCFAMFFQRISEVEQLVSRMSM